MVLTDEGQKPSNFVDFTDMIDMDKGDRGKGGGSGYYHQYLT